MTSNVLQLVGSFHQGGSERQAVQLARTLRRDGRVNVEIATMRKEGPLLQEVASEFSDVAEFKIGSFFGPGFVSGVRAAAHFVQERKIDVIHSHDFYTNVFGAAVAAVSGVSKFVASKREAGGMRSPAQNLVERIAFRKADAVLANSEAVKKHLEELGVASRKIEVIYNGLDVERMTPKVTDRRKICGILGLPQDENLRFITLVANLRHEVKNQRMFLRAAVEIAANQADVHFVIAGEGELKGALEEFVRTSGVAGRVHFIGRCESVPELLYVSHACALTSFHEGFPNAVLEYMSAAKPVVATEVGGVPEVLEDGGQGFLVPSDDSRALALSLERLLSDPALAERLGANGKRHVAQNFSTQLQVDRTLKLYGI